MSLDIPNRSLAWWNRFRQSIWLWRHFMLLSSTQSTASRCIPIAQHKNRICPMSKWLICQFSFAARSLRIQYRCPSAYIQLDSLTIHNLELVRNCRSKPALMAWSVLVLQFALRTSEFLQSIEIWCYWLCAVFFESDVKLGKLPMLLLQEWGFKTHIVWGS